MSCQSSPRRARLTKTQTENDHFRRHVAVFVILIWRTLRRIWSSQPWQVSWINCCMKGVTSTSGIHRQLSVLRNWQMVSNSDREALEWYSLMCVCGEKSGKKRRKKEGRKRKKWNGRGRSSKWTKIKQRVSNTFPQLPPYFGKGPTVIPQRGSYLAGVCYMVSVFNPRW